MKRRELMLLLGGAMTAAPALRAQQKAMPVIGFLSGAGSDGYTPFVAAFRQGLSEAGFVEGQNVAIEYRWADGRYERLPALAAEFVSNKVDVIGASGGPASARAAKNATSTIPIVFTSGGDPIAMGLVASLARPGGNLTGVSFLNVELMPKRLELLSELVPDAKVIALLVNPKNPNAEQIIRDMQEAARAKAVKLHTLKAATESGIDTAFASLVRAPCRRARRRLRSVLCQSARAARGAGGAPCRRGDLRVAPICRRRRPDQLWDQLNRCLSPGSAFTPAGSSTAPSRPICRSSSRPPSSWSSISRPRGRSASPSRPRSSPASTRSSNETARVA